jgi:RND superfamily putative drug exporter
VALLAAATTVIVLPALLLVLGPRIDALSLRRRKRAPAPGTSRWVRLGPGGHATAGHGRRGQRCAALALGLPFLRADFGGTDAGFLPVESGARQVSDALARDFDA